MGARERAVPAASGALSAEEQARGRRLTFLSHQAGMLHRFAYTEQLPTLALVALGAGEAVVGLQRAFEPVGQLLQLPTLRAVARYRKRTILMVGQALATLGGLPLVAFAFLAGVEPWQGLALALTSLALTALGLVVSQTVWFPMLHGYVVPTRVGAFFGLLRTTWHVTLLAFFLFSQQWLAAHPGAFGLLFGLASVAGVLRLALVSRLPERPGELGQSISLRRSLALAWHDVPLRRYLAGVSLANSTRRMVVPFLIVMMRRVLELSEAEVVLATMAYLAGGLVSLWGWGVVVDRLGPFPVFAGTATGTALVLAALLGVDASWGVGPMIAVFFALSLLASGFGVADTRVLFSLAPEQAPTRIFVVATVVTSVITGLAPLGVGIALDAALSAGVPDLEAYRALFALGALVVLVGLAPLRGFRELG